MQLFKSKIIRILFIVSLGLIFIGVVSSFYNNFIVRNISISEPLGYYLKLPILGDIQKNRRYMICLNEQEYIDIMHRLGLPKEQVSGIPGDWIMANELGIFINGIYQINTAPILKHKGISLKPLPFTYHHKLESDEYFVLGTTRTSYDSRYFGVIKRNQFKNHLVMLMNNN